MQNKSVKIPLVVFHIFCDTNAEHNLLNNCRLVDYIFCLFDNIEHKGSLKSGCNFVDFVFCPFEGNKKVSTFWMQIFRKVYLYNTEQRFVYYVFCALRVTVGL